MTPGLAFFYGGLVRSKNVVNTMMIELAAMGVVAVQWVLWGYSLAFGPNDGLLGSFAGGLQWLGLRGRNWGRNPDYSARIPHQLFMILPGDVCDHHPALISGAIVER